MFVQFSEFFVQNLFVCAGRAGRMSKGKVFRLYTEQSYNKLPDQIPPEIQRSDLASTVLYLVWFI